MLVPSWRTFDVRRFEMLAGESAALLALENLVARKVTCQDKLN